MSNTSPTPETLRNKFAAQISEWKVDKKDPESSYLSPEVQAILLTGYDEIFAYAKDYNKTLLYFSEKVSAALRAVQEDGGSTSYTTLYQKYFDAYRMMESLGFSNRNSMLTIAEGLVFTPTLDALLDNEQIRSTSNADDTALGLLGSLIRIVQTHIKELGFGKSEYLISHNNRVIRNLPAARELTQEQRDIIAGKRPKE